MKRLAIFDVDGTLFEGNMGIELLKTLIDKGLFDKKIGSEIFEWYQKYKSGEMEKTVVVDKIYELYALGMTGQLQKNIELASQETWNNISNKLFGFSKELVKLFKDKNFIVVLLSGSSVEMVKILGKELDADEVIAGTLEIVDGIYTGKIVSYPGSADQKIEAINKYISDRNIETDWKNSFGMGDNERDLEILKLVGIPVAFEPNEALKNVSQDNNITVLDRNNVVETVTNILLERKY